LKNADFGRDSLCLFTGTERSFLFMKIKTKSLSIVIGGPYVLEKP